MKLSLSLPLFAVCFVLLWMDVSAAQKKKPKDTSKNRGNGTLAKEYKVSNGTGSFTKEFKINKTIIEQEVTKAVSMAKNALEAAKEGLKWLKRTEDAIEDIEDAETKESSKIGLNIARLASNTSIENGKLAVDLAKEAERIWAKKDSIHLGKVFLARQRAFQAANTGERSLKNAHLAASISLEILSEASSNPKLHDGGSSNVDSEIQQTFPIVADFLKSLQKKIAFYLELLITLFGGSPVAEPHKPSIGAPGPNGGIPGSGMGRGFEGIGGIYFGESKNDHF